MSEQPAPPSCLSTLKDGQQIVLFGMGFTPNATIQIVECDANQQLDCDQPTGPPVMANATGGFIATQGASQSIQVSSGRLIDCAKQPCVIEVQNATDHAQTANMLIGFAPAVPPPVPPSPSVKQG